MDNSTNKQWLPSWLILLGILTAIAPLSIDMYLPSFPLIEKDLMGWPGSVELTLGSFFIGLTIGQLFYGPLLERFGRKKPLYFGLTLYAIAAFACAITTNVENLIAFRFLQALGGCVGMVASRAMVRDLFDVKENAKVFSTLMLVVAVSPIIAPTLGGYITSWLGWRFIFGILIIVIVCIILGVYFILPESKKPDPHFSLRPGSIINSFKDIIKNPQFSMYTFTGAVAYAGLYAYISGSPYVFMVIFKVSERHYGWIFAIVAAGLIGATQLNNLLLKKYSSAQIIKAALYTQSLIGLFLATFSMLGISELYSTIILVFLFLCCQGFIFPNASALSMAPFSNNAGSASALMGFIQMSVGAFMSAMVSVLQTNSSLAMTGVMATCSVSASLLLTIRSKKMIKEASLLEVEEEEIEMMNTL